MSKKLYIETVSSSSGGRHGKGEKVIEMEETVSLSDMPVPLSPEINGLPIIAIDLPVVYEDEGQEETGDSLPHTLATEILYHGIMAHLSAQARYRVFSDLNLLYHPIKKQAYVSPDVMVVVPSIALANDIASFRLGVDGPAPLLALEVLSPRTAQQGDLTLKPRIYAEIGVKEFILVDPSRKYLERQLILRKLQPDEKWLDVHDDDGGVTSALGFRIILDDDGQVRVTDAMGKKKYLRPSEAEVAADAGRISEERRRMAEEGRRAAEEAKIKAEARTRELEAEIARLRTLLPPDQKD